MLGVHEAGAAGGFEVRPVRLERYKAVRIVSM